MSEVRVSLAEQRRGLADAVSAQQMLIDSGRAKLGLSDARYQLARLKAAHATLLRMEPAADILRAVLQLGPERLASLRELLVRWNEEAKPTGAPPAERLVGGEAGGGST